jgi:hypothetical protein
MVLPLLMLLCMASSRLGAEELTPHEIHSVQSLVVEFYKAAHGGHNYNNMDVNLISEELNALIRLARAVEKRSSRYIQESDTPTDKPRLMEGALFSDHYEGYSQLRAIKKISKRKSAYFAEVELVYDREPPELVWTDTVVVIVEDGRWKVDNILFQEAHEPPDGASVKQVLRSFSCQHISWDNRPGDK